VAPRDEIREILPAPVTTRIPSARPWLMGVANHRGNLLAVTDLAVLFGFPAVPSNREQRVLVLNSVKIPAGFLVDEVGGYRQFAPTDQRHELVHTGGALEPFLLGAFVREGRPWLTLSLRKVAYSDQFVHASH
jgi:twitching motility protein PilI